MLHSYVLRFGVPGFLEETVAGIVAILPHLIGALVVLLFVWVLVVAIAKVVRNVVDRA